MGDVPAQWTGSLATRQEFPNPDPRQAAKSDVKAASPIDAQGIGVFPVPVVIEAFQLSYETFFARQQPCFGERYQELMSAEFPCDLAVPNLIEIEVVDFRPGPKGSPLAADNIEVPVNFLPVPEWSVDEQRI